MAVSRALKAVLSGALLIIVSLVITDLALHGVGALVPQIDEIGTVAPKHLPDERLGHRPNPNHPEHDAWGFRNPGVPARAEIVVLGDSQSYGAGVGASQAWPRVLEELNGQTVYNLSFGGWGPVHSLLLWHQAETLRPEVVIVSVYAGNDLYDSFKAVYDKALVAGLRSDDRETLDLIAQADDSGTLKQRVGTIYREGRKKRTSRLRRFRKSIKQWLADHSKIYGLLWRAGYEISLLREERRNENEKWRKARARAEKRPQVAQAFARGPLRTVFTSQLRLSVLDLDDPRVREGQRIVYEVLRQMQDAVGATGARFVVLLIPTKEYVFGEQAKTLAEPAYRKLLDKERLFWRETRGFLDDHAIGYIDALPSLRAQLDSGPQPYKVSDDGHPNEHGHRAIARAVRQHLGNAR